MRQPQLAVLVSGLALLTACGTTVPSAQQQATGTSGLAGSSGSTTGTSDAGSAGGSTTGGDSATSAGTTGTSTTGTSTTGSTGGGSTTSASTTTGAGTSGGTTGSIAGPVPGSASSIPVSGRGWDAKHVYIGVPTADDFNSVIKGAGASVSNGDVKGEINAIVASINKAGGVYGRQVVVAYHNAATTDYSTNTASTAQSMCTYFTQDRPVIAVFNGSPQLDGAGNFHSCLEKSKVALVSISNTDYDDADYVHLGPHLWTTGSLSTDILVPSFVSALGRQHFFSGWDSLAGAPGKAPAKIGALLPDTTQGHHVSTLIAADLKKQGLKLTTTFFYDPVGLGQKAQAEVLQMSSAGVTHILDLPPIAAEIWFFQAAAEQQKYRPRYGFTSFVLPLAIEQDSSIVPLRQQVGSMGIGWQPYNDVNSAHDPGPVPGSKRCMTALAAGGQTFSASQRRAALLAVQACDGFYLLRDAMLAGHGFSPSALLAGMPSAGSRLQTAGTFGGGLTLTDHGLPGTYRDQVFVSSCSCYAYTGPTHPFTRS